MANNSKKRKRTSPFRIKVGCLVALRYRPRGNEITLETPDGKVFGSSNGNSNNNINDESLLYSEPIQSAHFSEVWTDPQVDRDDGLALIGSRIRCIFPKSVLSEPHRATSRVLEGEVVNVVDYVKQYRQRRVTWRERRESVGTVVDLLIDNKGNKQIQAMPFLQRVDPVVDDTLLRAMSDTERRSHYNEERIRGGGHKAIVRVLLSDERSSGIMLRKNGNDEQRTYIEARWVVRKRVPVKIVPAVGKATASSNASTPDERTSREDSQEPSAEHDLTHMQKLNVARSGGTSAKFYSNGSAGDGKQISTVDKAKIEDVNANSNESNYNMGHQSETILSTTETQKKRRKITSDKDFSLPRYLGDGSDSTAQQEANWRWQAGKYNPCSVLADRPISQELLKRFCYNFVGEVVRIEPQASPTSSTLATVTLKRLVLPEHTATGRTSMHGPYDAFEDADLKPSALIDEYTIRKNDNNDSGAPDREQKLRWGAQNQSCFFKVPIEELVIVSRKVERDLEGDCGVQSPAAEMTVRKSYSIHSDTYVDLKNDGRLGTDSSGVTGTEEEMRRRRCRRCRHESMTTKRLMGVSHLLCQSCIIIIKKMDLYRGGKNTAKQFKCDCDYCLRKEESDRLSDLSAEVDASLTKLGPTLQALEDYSTNYDSGFISTRFVTKGMSPVDFTMFPDVNSFSFASASKPIAKANPKKTLKKVRKTPIGRNLSNACATGSENRNGKVSNARQSSSAITPFSSKVLASNLQLCPLPSKREVFRPTSSRLLPYDAANRKFDVSAADLYQWKMYRSSFTYPEKPRNLRFMKKNEIVDDGEKNLGGKKKLLGRAARAKQRRLVRGVAAMGVNVDALAGREQQLRFDRSAIHDWGVFVDIDIREGEMIVEYRGEIIGNAMAEKREIEYEAAKIGSDYMFRMDDLTVCDATKQGNVARFINASCDPNCYTKIISLGGTKRIVVYAKRDIQSGEELSYDYKFPLEPDPSQRIPCRCGARECRGYLNWDSRYADKPATNDKATNYDENKRARIKGSEAHYANPGT